MVRVAGVDIGQPYARLIWMYSVGLGAFYGVNALIILYLSRHFDVTENSIGFFFMYMGSLSIIFRLFLLGPAVDKFGEVRTARLGALSLACGFALVPLTSLREAHGAAEHQLAPVRDRDLARAARRRTQLPECDGAAVARGRARTSADCTWACSRRTAASRA